MTPTSKITPPPSLPLETSVLPPVVLEEDSGAGAVVPTPVELESPVEPLELEPEPELELEPDSEPTGGCALHAAAPMTTTKTLTR